MPTRALGALLAAVAAALFVVSIVTAAWWDGHPRVDGHVFVAKDVHIGLLGGEGCNTGGAGACQSLELGPVFHIAGYAEIGAVGLATLLALLVAGAAWRVSDGRKRIAKAALSITALAVLGALALLVIGPQIKSTQKVEAPIGWGLFVFAGGVVSALVASLTTLRVEREPLRLKTTAKAPPEQAFDVRDILREQHDGLRPSALGPEPMLGPGAGNESRHLHHGPAAGNESRHLHHGPGASGSLPGPAGPLGAPLVPQAPQLRPLYDVQGAIPAPMAPQLPQRAPTPIPRASAHAMAGLDYERPPTFESAETSQNQRQPAPPGFDPRTRPPTGAPPFGQPQAPGMPAPPFGQPQAPGMPAPPFGQPQVPAPFGGPPAPFGGRPAPFARPATQPPPFAQPAIAAAPYEPPPRPGTAVRVKAASVPPPIRPSVVGDNATDPLGKTMPAPGKLQPPPPRSAKPSVPPPVRAGARPIVPLPARPLVPDPVTAGPTPSIITSAPRAGSPRTDGPAPRPSQPTLAHTVPPMPQIDTPPPQTRASTEADGRLDAAMRETEYITAVEIDAEAKAAAHSHARASTEGEEATGISEPPIHEEPRTTSEERAAMHDEGLAPHARGDVPGDDTETAARERVDADKIDEAATPPTRTTPVKPPLSTAPASLPPPKVANIPASGPTPACPQCEAPMAWVEEHLRFYCKSCRMYF